MTDLDPTTRVLVTTLGRGVYHGVRPSRTPHWTWCGRECDEQARSRVTTSPAVVITCGQCLRRGEASRGHLELIR